MGDNSAALSDAQAQLQLGDVVVGRTAGGGLQQLLDVPARDVVRVPVGVDVCDAAAVDAYTTAYDLVMHAARDKLHPGASVLVHGGAGAVGIALIQLLRSLGITEVFATCAAGKMSAVGALGAVPIDYRAEEYTDRVMQLTDGRGVNVVFDPIGGASIARSYACLRTEGKLISYALAESISSTVSDSRAVGSYASRCHLAQTFAGYNARVWDKRVCVRAGRLAGDMSPDRWRHDCHEVLELMSARRIRPFAFARVDLAHADAALMCINRMKHVNCLLVLVDAGVIAHARKCTCPRRDAFAADVKPAGVASALSTSLTGSTVDGSPATSLLTADSPSAAAPASRTHRSIDLTSLAPTPSAASGQAQHRPAMGSLPGWLSATPVCTFAHTLVSLSELSARPGGIRIPVRAQR